MQNIIPIENGKYYHIYNRGINGTELFHSNENYLHFLRLYDEYIEPVADTFAWCLMRNHFHLLVRIKEEEEILESITGFQNLSGLFLLKTGLPQNNSPICSMHIPRPLINNTKEQAHYLKDHLKG